MLTGLHFLLTYTCNWECDHCFVFGSPKAKGTFTIAQIRDILAEAKKTGTVESVCFEGGEPFLYYAVMLEGIRLATEAGFSAGIVTNTYWARAEEDAALWLKPLVEAGLGSLTVSDDSLHFGDTEDTPAKRAVRAAEALGIGASAIAVDEPCVVTGDSGTDELSGGVMFRGRAIEKMAEGLPLTAAESFTECPHENLADPGRVHLDCYGNVLLCQGLSMGDMWQVPLSELVAAYDPQAHPIVGPLTRGGGGGPVELAREYGVKTAPGYLDACHMCYEVRKALVDRFPVFLAPRQLYGLE